MLVSLGKNIPSGGKTPLIVQVEGHHKGAAAGYQQQQQQQLVTTTARGFPGNEHCVVFPACACLSGTGVF